MTNYEAGRRIEYRVKKDLELKGFTVMRTAGSHGHFDLIAYEPKGLIHLIQLKYSNKESPTKDEIKKFQSCPFPKPAKGLLIHYKRGNTTPTIIERQG